MTVISSFSAAIISCNKLANYYVNVVCVCVCRMHSRVFVRNVLQIKPLV